LAADLPMVGLRPPPMLTGGTKP